MQIADHNDTQGPAPVEQASISMMTIEMLIPMVLFGYLSIYSTGRFHCVDATIIQFLLHTYKLAERCARFCCPCFPPSGVLFLA